jgi:hypothetical protein
MKSFKLMYEERTEKTITVKCYDQDNSLEDLIEFIKSNGNGGHSFEIIVDPDGDDTQTFGWDGDGGDRINDIKVT